MPWLPPLTDEEPDHRKGSSRSEEDLYWASLRTKGKDHWPSFRRSKQDGQHSGRQKMDSQKERKSIDLPVSPSLPSYFLDLPPTCQSQPENHSKR